MKKFIVPSVLLLLFSSCATNKGDAIIQDSSSSVKEFKVAVVDLVSMEQGSLAIKNLNKAMKNKEEDIKKILTNDRKSLEDEYKQLQEKQSVLDKKTLETKAKKLEERYYEMQMNEKIYVQAMEYAKMQVLQDLQVYIKKASSDVSSGYDLILPSNSILTFNKDKIEDVTAEVLKKLNDTYTKVKFDEYYNESVKEFKKQIPNK